MDNTRSLLIAFRALEHALFGRGAVLESPRPESEGRSPSKGLSDVPCPEARSHFSRGVVAEELEGGHQQQEPVVRCNTDSLGRAVGVDVVPHVAPRGTPA